MLMNTIMTQIAIKILAGAPVALERLVASLEPQPAYVLGPAWQFLAWNPAQERLFPHLHTLPETERNLLWLVFGGGFAPIIATGLYARYASSTPIALYLAAACAVSLLSIILLGRPRGAYDSGAY